MKKLIYLSSFFFTLVIFFTLPSSVLAGPTDSLKSPGGDYPSLGAILTAVIPLIFGLVAFLAVIVFVIGALRYILSRGDPKAADGARGTMTGAIIGLVIVLGTASLSGVFDRVFGLGFFGTNNRPGPIGNGPVDLSCAFKLNSGSCIGQQYSSFGQLATFVLQLLLAVGGLVFFFMLVFGGIRYITAQGDEKAVQSARSTLTNAGVGLLLIIIALVIIRLIASKFFGFSF